MSNIEDDIKILTEENSSYKKEQAMQNILSEREQDKARIKELEKENRKLKVIRSEYAYGYENTYFITKNDLVQIDKNKYLIEIEEGKFVDLKQVYLDNKNSIPKQKIKDKIEDIKKGNYSSNYNFKGGRENGKNFKFGFKVGMLKALKELLEEGE